MGRRVKIGELAELVNELSNALETAKGERDNYRNQLLDTRHELTEKDYTLENLKHSFENVSKTLKLYERENKALKELVFIHGFKSSV